ncbi:Conserved hypothetical protein, gene in Ubiquinol-cytochrome C chaperone locus [hydrothermal vent metagenome]|uniref:COG1399 protein, clustered with ribosomal protein L32p n=1 Tax=hydrothermal vent metagenome TaxID=652676 RepID=A0A3B0TF99_9ZZZZ
MNDHSQAQPVYRISELSGRKPHRFSLTLDAPARAVLAQELGITGIRKLTFQGSLQADGKSDWVLEATLGTTVIQPCVVTLEPVVTRIDRRVIRRFIAGHATPQDGEDTEMPEDETVEALPDEIDMARIIAEALTLALPDYPRSDDAALETDSFAPPGITPMTNKDVKPFAGLAELRDKLDKSS